MSDRSRPMSQTLHDSAPSKRQSVKFLTAATIGVSTLFLSLLTLAGTVMSLIVVTPVLILFSPVLVPVATVMILAMLGLLFSGALGVAAITSLSWIYRYATGKDTVGSGQLDYVRDVNVREMAKDCVQQKARESTDDGDDRSVVLDS